MSIRTGGAPLTIVDGIRVFAAAQPQTPAVIDGTVTLTYRQLDERSSRLAHSLIDAALVPGQTVAVLLGNRLEYCEVAAGIAKAGLVMVPLNPRMTAPEIAYIVEHSESRALILDEASAQVAAAAAGGLATVLSIDGTTLGRPYEPALEAASDADPMLTIDERDPFCIAYTSGTTGKPKGVMISHRSRSLTFLASAMEWNLGIGRRSIAVAPLYHGAGFAFGYSPVHTGGTVSMLRAWSPEALLAMIERDHAQSVFLVPTHAQMLKTLGPERIASFDLSSLDTLFFNAAALPTHLKTWVMQTFPNVGVHELYGSTESGIISDLRPSDAVRKPGSVGHAWFLTEIKVLDGNGQPVPPGVPGELFSRSPYLMNGYLKDEQATAACTSEDGFITCGDIVTRDEDGCLYIVDRKKDVIISGGSNVYPREVEEAALRHPAVREIAVIGAEDETWGEQVVAVVVLEDGASLTLEELDNHLRPMLGGYKIPRELVLVSALPVNSSGKVLKRTLRDRPAAS
ncbi:MAG: AMP-binding protein [Candidatus Nanopelagicales bacterium]